MSSLARDELGVNVQRPRPIETRGVYFIDTARNLHAGVIVQDVDAAMPFGDVIDNPPDGGIVRNVQFRAPPPCPSGCHDRAHGFPCRGEVAVGDDHQRALACHDL